MAGMAAVFSELERALIGQRTAEALAELRSQRRVYGPVPFGYEAADDRLIEREAEQQVLRRIRAMRRRSLSYDRIAHRLNSEGVKAKRGGDWHAMGVRSVVRTSERLRSAA